MHGFQNAKTTVLTDNSFLVHDRIWSEYKTGFFSLRHYLSLRPGDQFPPKVEPASGLQDMPVKS